MKNVLLLVHDDPGQEARLQAALDVVQALDGNLTCLDVTDIPDRAFRAFAPPVAAMVLEDAAASERRIKAMLVPRLAARGLVTQWIDAAGNLEDAMVRHARLADLVVINTLLRDEEFPDMVKLARALVGATHAPVLAVPPSATEFRATGAAVILWDGSNDAEAALVAAVPLLTRACQVTIVQVDTGRPAVPTREAASYLRKHGIIAHLSKREAVDTPAHLLGSYLRRHAPAYAVMGAFGHGRVHDALFGSVTAHLLATSTVPLLIASHV